MWHFSLFQVRQFSIIPRSFFRLKNFWMLKIMFNSCYSAVQDWRFCGIMHGPRDSMLAVKKLASECFINKYLMKMLVHKKIWVHTPSDYIWVRCDLYQSKLWTCHPYHVIVRKKVSPPAALTCLRMNRIILALTWFRVATAWSCLWVRLCQI